MDPNANIRRYARPAGAGWSTLALLVAGAAVLAWRPGDAAVMGAAPAQPMAEAIRITREAATAVLEKGGSESCLRGKLTNALLGLSSSCEAAGLRSPLCRLADQVVVTTGWSVPFMEDSARRLLDLSQEDSAPTLNPSSPSAGAR